MGGGRLDREGGGYHAIQTPHRPEKTQPTADRRQRLPNDLSVSQRLGHSTVELTLRGYFHLLPDADDSLAGMTDELFS